MPTPRTERDIPIHWVAGIVLVLVVPIAAIFSYFISATDLPISAGMTSGLIRLCGRIRTAVRLPDRCGLRLHGRPDRLSNSPVSGIGILSVAWLLLLVIRGQLGAGRPARHPLDRHRHLRHPVVLAIATISNDNLQDLKTGQLVGATPWRQQVALIVGVLLSARW